MPKRTIIFGKAFQDEPSTGDLSTVPEFGGILIGQLDKYFSLSPIGTQSVFGRKSTRVARGALFLLDEDPIAFCDCILQNQLLQLALCKLLLTKLRRYDGALGAVDGPV